MTDEERKEAEKSFRISIHFYKWIFIVFGNWKREITYVNSIGFKIHDFHLLNPKKARGL